MKNTNLMLVLAMTLGASSVVVADSSDASELWKALDANKDGVISKDEAATSQDVSAQWNLLDLNQDGVLSEKEFSLIKLSDS